MITLASEVRSALKEWRNRPGFVLAALLSLGLGIGANTAIFSVVHGVLLEPLPFSDPERLFMIHSRHTSTDRYPFQLPEYCDHRDGNRTLAAMAAYAGWNASLTGEGEAERLLGMRASGNLFEMLGVTAALGRTLLPADDAPDADRVVVLSHGLWVRRFGGDPGVVGRSVRLNAESYTVVGILPAAFRVSPRDTDAVVALRPDADPWRHNRDSTSFLRVIGRAKAGAGRSAIQADLDAIARRLQEQFPSSYARKPGVQVVPWAKELVRDLAPVLWVLQGAVALLLLITCANMASLLLIRVAARRRVIAVRRALGASPGDIFRRQMIEGLLLALGGGVAGLLIAGWSVPALLAMAPPDLSRPGAIGLRPGVLLFTAIIAVASGLMSAALPAWRAARGDLRESLAAAGRSHGHGRETARLRSIIVAGEVALLAALLSGAMLLYRSFREASQVAPGFEAEALTVRLSLPGGRYGDIGKMTTFYRDLESRLAALPGVRLVAAVNHVPLNGALASADYRTSDMPAGSDAQLPTADYRMATPHYFRAMGIPLIAGRAFRDEDDADAPPVAIISRALALRSYQGRDPIGERILVKDTPEGFRSLEIVGIAGDVRHDSLEAEATPHLFVPYAQTRPQLLVWLAATQFLVVRAGVEPLSLEPGIRRALREVDADVAASQLMTTGAYMEASIAPRRFALTLMGLFALLATLMAAIGLHVVVSSTVAWRTREMAVRMALGARPSQTRALVLRQGVWLATAGLAAGLVIPLACSRLMKGLLFGVTTADPTAHAAAMVLLAFVVLAACDGPARRAARVPPVDSLRAE